MPQFVKGMSGNPGGRPKKSDTMRAALERVMAARDAATGKPNKQAIADALVEQAKRGNLAAIGLIFDRIDGKAVDRVQGDGDLTVRVVYDDPKPPFDYAAYANVWDEQVQLAARGYRNAANGEHEVAGDDHHLAGIARA